jgi:hypothetical protein
MALLLHLYCAPPERRRHRSLGLRRTFRVSWAWASFRSGRVSCARAKRNGPLIPGPPGPAEWPRRGRRVACRIEAGWPGAWELCRRSGKRGLVRLSPGSATKAAREGNWPAILRDTYRVYNGMVFHDLLTRNHKRRGKTSVRDRATGPFPFETFFLTKRFFRKVLFARKSSVLEFHQSRTIVRSFEALDSVLKHGNTNQVEFNQNNFLILKRS